MSLPDGSYLEHILARIKIGPNYVLCTKIRFSPSTLSLYKDYHPLAHLRYKYHWWELSNEMLHKTFLSMGTWDTKGQTFTLLNLLNKRALSWNFWLWLVIILIPFEIKLHAVPHLKGLINGICTSSGPRDGSLYALGKSDFST